MSAHSRLLQLIEAKESELGINYQPWPGWLHLDGYGGRTVQAIVVMGETPKKYRVTPAGDSLLRLGGRRRFIAPGETALVPRRAVTARREETP